MMLGFAFGGGLVTGILFGVWLAGLFWRRRLSEVREGLERARAHNISLLRRKPGLSCVVED